MNDGQRKQRMSLLSGAALFFGLVVYFNLRSPEPTTAVDWVVMGIGGSVLLFALVRYFRRAQ